MSGGVEGEQSVRPPEVKKVRKKSGGNWGGGKPEGSGVEPIKAPREVIVDAVVELSAGVTGKEVGVAHQLSKTDVRKLQGLVGLAPQEYFDAIANRMEPVLGKLNDALEMKLEAILAGEDETTVKELAVAVGIYRQNLAEIRGQSKPASVHQTNIQINNFSREDAKRFLLGNNNQ